MKGNEVCFEYECANTHIIYLCLCWSYSSRIHLETSSVLIRQLPVEFVKKPDNWNYAPLSMGERSSTITEHCLLSVSLNLTGRVLVMG